MSISFDEKRLLSSLLTPVQPKLRLAWGISIFSTVLLIAQMGLLATIFAHLLAVQFNYDYVEYVTDGPAATSAVTAGSDGWSSLLTLQQHWWLYLLGLTLCFVARPLLGMWRDRLGFESSVQVRKNLRAKLLSAMAQLGASRHRFGSDGSLSSQIIEQTEALDGYVSRFAVQKMVTVSTPLMILAAVMWQSWVAAIIMLLTAPLVPVFMILIGHLTARKSAEQFVALSQLSGRFLDWIRGMPTLKRLQATDMAQQDLANSSEAYRHRTMDVLKIAFLNGAALEFLAALCIALTAVYLGFGLMGILPWQKNDVPVPYFGALFILLLAPEFYAPLRQLGSDYHAKAQAEGAMQSLLPILQAANVLEDEQTIQDNSQDSNPSSDLNQPGRLDGMTTHGATLPFVKPFAIHAQNLTITGRQGRTRLAPVDFTIAAGSRVAVTGDSGSGKSSLIQALMGFVDGEDSMGGQLELCTERGTFSVSSLLAQGLLTPYRSQIGYLSQQVALMPMSIADNLRLANPDADDAAIWSALEAVHLADFLRQLPNGLNTCLGERGRGLSGGQQQRLGIAQLLLQDASLWLLDEPTEHLDPDTAAAVHDVLRQVSTGKTVLWVTHHHEQLPWLDDRLHLLPPPPPTNTLNQSNPPNSQEAL